MTDEEIVWAVHQLNPQKSPGPDGILAFFTQEFWSLVRQDVLNLIMYMHSSILVHFSNLLTRHISL